jgi:small subunit ribosomal protein S1
MSEHELRPEAVPTAGQPDAEQTTMAPTDNAPAASHAIEAASSPAPPAEEGVPAEQPPATPAPSAAEPAVSQQSAAQQQTTTDSSVQPQPFQKIELPPAEEKPAPVVVTDELLARLQGIMERGEPITVHVAQRIRGGLRVMFEGIKMFLPSSQFFLKKSPTASELQSVVGTDIPVHIAEIVKDEAGRISFIVTRRNLLRQEFYQRFKVGDIVEGTVTSVQSFGLFVDIGGFDGLVHISRVSHQPPADLNATFKRGDQVRAQIVEIDPAHDKISLSMKALEPSPWQAAAERYQPGQRYRGVVRRLVPFGAFVELEPGIEGLIRLGELSWTRRITDPAEVLREGQEVEVVVLEVKPEREQIDLSIRRTTENPWPGFVTKYPRGFHTTGVVRKVSGPGVLLTIGGEVDAFMPRSHMRSVLKGKRIPYSPGDIVAVTIVEVDPNSESLIVEPRVEPEEELFGPPRESAGAPPAKPREQRPANPTRITLGELLSEEERQRLFGSSQ